MRKLLKVLLPIAVIAAASAAAVVTVANRQQPERRAPKLATTQVTVTPVERTD
jgi:hypothetical protein